MNRKFFQYWLKKSLYYPGITLCAGICLKIYFTLIPHYESALSGGPFLMDLAGLILLLGAVYIMLLTFSTFGAKMNSCISYGATRRQSVSVLFSSTAAGAVILMLIFTLLYTLGSAGGISLRLTLMELNLYLLSMALAFPGGYLVMKYGKPAYLIAAFVFLFIFIAAGVTLTLYFGGIPGSDWTWISETFCGSPLLTPGLAALFAGAWLLLCRSTERMEVKV